METPPNIPGLQDFQPEDGGWRAEEPALGRVVHVRRLTPGAEVVAVPHPALEVVHRLVDTPAGRFAVVGDRRGAP
ncbi:MAG: hypothetical protein R3F43_12790 [bacterium]